MHMYTHSTSTCVRRQSHKLLSQQYCITLYNIICFTARCSLQLYDARCRTCMTIGRACSTSGRNASSLKWSISHGKSPAAKTKRPHALHGALCWHFMITATAKMVSDLIGAGSSAKRLRCVYYVFFLLMFVFIYGAHINTTSPYSSMCHLFLR